MVSVNMSCGDSNISSITNMVIFPNRISSTLMLPGRLVTLPNSNDSHDTTLAALAKGTQDRSLCRLHRFEVPALHTGTLDSLIALSDELSKYNSQVEVSPDRVR